jgi:hypothetical protein
VRSSSLLAFSELWAGRANLFRRSGANRRNPPAAEATPEGRSFADTVGQRKRVPIPDPFPIVTDPVTGVKLFEDKREVLMVIKFDEKPPQVVIDMVMAGVCGSG